MSPPNRDQAYALKSVYLIDDNPLDGWITSRIMEKHRFTKHLVLFEEGAKALAAIEQALATQEEKRLPQVILLDIEMPVYNGWDFLEDFARLPAAFTGQCLLYLLSASISPSDIRKARGQAMVQAYLIKPLSAATLNQIGKDHSALPSAP